MPAAGDNRTAPPRIWQPPVRRPGERRSRSGSATRALDVLEHFGALRRPLRAIEIAKALDLHPSTVNQLLKTMVESAHLTFDATTKAYLPSPRLARFGGWMVESFGAEGRLRALVRALQAASGHVVTLTTPNDLFMQIVDLAGAAPEGQVTERGLRVSMFGSAIGAVYLATLGEAEIARLAHRARIPPADLAEIMVQIARVRLSGFADRASTDGIMWSVAASLPREGLRAPLVLGVSGLSGQVRPKLASLRTLLASTIARFLPPV